MREEERRLEADENDLVDLVQKGDLPAFERLLELHSSRLRAFVAMKLPIPYLIDEIAHETFIFAYRHISEFERGTDFGKWLRAIAFNLIRKEALRYQRLNKNREKLLEHRLVQNSLRSSLAPDAPMLPALEECLSQLPEQQRKLLERKYTLSESSREIAAAIGQSETWVRTTLYRIRGGLRTCIEHRMREMREPS